MIDPVRLLLVEDSPGDAELVREYFSEFKSTPLELRQVGTMAEALEALRGPLPDAILLDLNLPDSEGIETLHRLMRLCPDVPAIVITGDLPPNLRQQLLSTGATECIAKASWTYDSLTAAVRFAVKLRRALGLQRQMERLLAVIPDGVMVVDPSGRVRYVNDAAVALFGKRREDFIGEPVDFAIPHGDITSLEIVRAGERVGTEMRAVPVEWGGHAATMITIRDTTESTRLAEQLFQAQKMEAVGLLAGGIAHDFNNLITVILAYGVSIKETMPSVDPRQDDLTQLLAAADRATSLTRQLLAVARRHPVQVQVLQLDALAGGLKQLMQRALPDNTVLHVRTAPEIWPVVADAGHIEQVLLNLLVNARDAMPRGGTVVIEIDNVENTAPAEGFRGGAAVRIRVSDSGAGIPASILPRIFQPFFTTKESGKGTGLGLATCYGIVRQAHGAISVESTVGVGTTFTILIPKAADDETAAAQAPLPAPDRLEGRETVLVVEDDEALRRSMIRSLRRFGYSILAATNGDEAKRVIDGHDGVVDLLLTDLVMPKVGGKELIESLRRTHPRLKVLCITGSAPHSNGDSPELPEAIEVLYKPFDPVTLMRGVRRVLSAEG
ncbi:MAG: response regulator [Gemmatimonadetes bacterium]|jgi:two-component system cell cycle sensor histidine kinase/response regulator CckA|nr:response regulator [Gemmatimonadota bacterium]MBK6843841.1 response regulator [Gemmatimonadota bacterium]